MDSLKNKKILVTGASSGIGMATAIYLSQKGAKVVITGRNEARLRACFEQLDGNDNIMVVADILNNDDIKCLLIDSVEDGIKLDGYVHCVGISAVMPVKVLSEDKLIDVFKSNFFSFIAVFKLFAQKKFSNEGASVAAMSAILAHQPRKFELAYISSKAALEAAIPVLAMEYSKRKIRVNSVIPGFVKTPMVIKAMEEYGNKEEMDQLASQFLYGWEQPEDIARIAAFMMSDNSKVINGRNIYADGGML